MKKTIIIFILINSLLSGCKYEPIYSQKKINFQISEIQIQNENKINLNIEKRLYAYKNVNSLKKIKLDLNSEKTITISSKDSRGDPKKFEMQIMIYLTVTKNENLSEKIEFIEKFKYNNTLNKFDLRAYEQNIEENLVNKIYQEILVYLSTI